MQNTMLWGLVACHRKLRDDCPLLAWKLHDVAFRSNLFYICSDQHAVRTAGDVDLIEMVCQAGVRCTDMRKS